MTALITGLLRKEPESRLTVQAARPLLNALAAPPARPAPVRTPTVVVDGAPDGPPALLPVRLLRGRYGAGAAAVVALALVVTLVLRFTGDGPPEGWKRYDEYRMGLSVAAPADWTIAVQDDLDNDGGAYRGTRYTAPKGDVWLLVDRMEKATETPGRSPSGGRGSTSRPLRRSAAPPASPPSSPPPAGP